MNSDSIYDQAKQLKMLVKNKAKAKNCLHNRENSSCELNSLSNKFIVKVDGFFIKALQAFSSEKDIIINGIQLP